VGESLGEALPKEMARVRAVMLEYSGPELGGSGAFAIAMMEQSLKEADRAVMEGDVVGMIRAYEDLKGYS